MLISAWSSDVCSSDLPDPPSAAPTDSDGGLNPAPHEVFPMSKVLIVAEHLDGKLNASTAKCVSAAQALSPEAIDIVVLAADPAAVAAEAAQVDGVSKVLPVEIGRASCRERVWQYGVISVGGV